MFRLINLSFVTFDALTSHFSRFVNIYYNYKYTTKVIDIRVEGVRGGYLVPNPSTDQPKIFLFCWRFFYAIFGGTTHNPLHTPP